MYTLQIIYNLFTANKLKQINGFWKYIHEILYLYILLKMT